MLSTQTLARYPFLKEAGAYIREHGPPLDELLEDIAYEEARLRGKRRVLDALEKGEIEEQPLSSDAQRLLELYSYPVARILVSCIADDFLIHRYALAEATRAREKLENEGLAFVLDISAQLGFDVKNGKELKVHFSDFLRNSAQIKAKEWKLANQDLDNGYVHLSRQRLLRLVQESVRKRVEEELPLEVNDKILAILQDYAQEIWEELSKRKEKYKAEDFEKVSITRLPPCKRKFVAMLQSGQNLPHSARFALTAFLRAIGMGTEEIMRLFASAPDFDDRKTRYQVEHITGRISGTVYTPPECSTMKSYNVCFDPDELCKRDWMNHPLTYYRIKSRGKRKGKGKTAGEKPKESTSQESPGQDTEKE
jgi:DNA primase large subunit